MPISYPENPVTIGEHIKKKRMELDLSQARVDNLFNVSKDCMTAWENGRNEPQINYYPRIIQFLGYSPWEFDKITLQGKLKEYRYKFGLNLKNLGGCTAWTQVM